MKSVSLIVLLTLLAFSSLWSELRVMKNHTTYSRDSRFIVTVSSFIGEKHTVTANIIENAFKRAFYDKVTGLKQTETKSDDIVFTDSSTFRDIQISLTVKNIHLYSTTVMFDLEYSITSDGKSFSDFTLYSAPMEKSSLPYAEKMASYVYEGAKLFVDDFFTEFIR